MSDYDRPLTEAQKIQRLAQQKVNKDFAGGFWGSSLSEPKEKNAAEPPTNPKALTLPTDSAERKNFPVLSGCLNYFPAALAGVSNVSKLGNDKHNPGQPLHHARGKSMDHGDCIIRHLIDAEDLLASLNRNDSQVTRHQILIEASQLAWRALAYSQELHERFGSPLAPGAKP